MPGYLIAALIVLVMLLIGAWLWGHRSGQRAMTELARRATRLGLAESDAAMRQATEDLTFAKRRWEEEERRAESFSAVVAGIIRERDQWRDLYFAEAIAHGNAQGYMMAFIEAQYRRLKQAGIEVALPPILAELKTGHARDHAIPATAANGNKSIDTVKQMRESQDLALTEGPKNVRE